MSRTGPSLSKPRVFLGNYGPAFDLGKGHRSKRWIMFLFGHQTDYPTSGV